MPSKKRIFDIIQIGQDEDMISRAFDYTVMGMIVVNLFIALFETYEASIPWRPILGVIEMVTVFFFTVEYSLRLWTSEHLYPGQTKKKAVLRYALSPGGIIDLLSFLPWYLPVFFPAGLVAFRMFRVVRILRLFRINAYSDALNVIGNVVKSKADQLLSSVFVILVLMIASSLCMYSLEHEAQPELFANAFSGLWWSVSTLLTVGYGDIYPITAAGRFFAIIISFLGVGMVAIPTGILSAGFVEQYGREKSLNSHARETKLHFIRLMIESGHPWEGKRVKELLLPNDLLLSVILRDDQLIPPTEEQMIHAGDILVLGAEDLQDGGDILLREIVLDEQHPWKGEEIQDLDLSRRTFVVLVRRGNDLLKPEPSLVLQEGDILLTYTGKRRRNHS